MFRSEIWNWDFHWSISQAKVDFNIYITCKFPLRAYFVISSPCWRKLETMPNFGGIYKTPVSLRKASFWIPFYPPPASAFRTAKSSYPGQLIFHTVFLRNVHYSITLGRNQRLDWCALKTEEGTLSQGTEVATRSWQRQGKLVSRQSPQKEPTLLTPLTLAQQIWFQSSDFWNLKRINPRCCKPLVCSDLLQQQ